jgi:hypothetical protein
LLEPTGRALLADSAGTAFAASFSTGLVVVCVDAAGLRCHAATPARDTAEDNPVCQLPDPAACFKGSAVTLVKVEIAAEAFPVASTKAGSAAV